MLNREKIDWKGLYFVYLNENNYLPINIAKTLEHYDYFPYFTAYLDNAGNVMRFVQYVDEEKKIAKYIIIPYDWIRAMIPLVDKEEYDKIEKFKAKLREENKPFIYLLWETSGGDEKAYMRKLNLPAYRVMTWKDSDDEREREEMNE